MSRSRAIIYLYKEEEEEEQPQPVLSVISTNSYKLFITTLYIFKRINFFSFLQPFLTEVKQNKSPIVFYYK